jgi:hypothetical protein
LSAHPPAQYPWILVEEIIVKTRPAPRAALTAAVALLLAVPAWAHRPIETSGAHASWQQACEVEQPGISQVIYREIHPDGPALWLSFEAQAGQEIFFSLGLPRLERLEGFRPAIAVVGPGLPVADLPVALPPDAGALVLEPSAEPREFHEPFTGTDSRILVERTVRFEAAGTYRLVAFIPPPQRPEGKLWVSIGDVERWGIGDLFRFPAIVNGVRAFHEVKPFPWWIPITTGAVVAAAGGTLLVLSLAGAR